MSNASNDHSYVPLDCPVCQLMMRDSADVSRYYVSKCCVDCWIGFLEPLRKLNRDEEYLPTGSEIESYRKRLALIKNHGEETC